MAKKSNNNIVALINKNFMIRWKYQDDSKTNLVSAGQYHTIVGSEMSIKHFKRALISTTMKYTIKVNNHLTIDFVVR